MAGAEGREQAEGKADTEVAVGRPRPPLHVGLYGEPHVGKSHMAASFVLGLVGKASMYVAFFDRPGKELTYEKVWRRLLGDFTTKDGKDPRGTPWRDYSWKGKRRARIAFYGTPIIQETDGASRFEDYIAGPFQAEVAEGRWGVAALDSVSFMVLDARTEDKYILNKASKAGNEAHGMKHYAHATDVAERVLCQSFPFLGCSTLAILHESKQLVETEGTMVRSPAVPGKRLLSTNMIAATFPELWRVYAERDEKGKKVRRLQTVSDESFQAGTIIGAPDGCRPHYEAVWAGWEG